MRVEIIFRDGQAPDITQTCEDYSTVDVRYVGGFVIVHWSEVGAQPDSPRKLSTAYPMDRVLRVEVEC